MVDIKLYPRGFIFSKQKLEKIPEHFKHKVINDYNYYYDNTSMNKTFKCDYGFIIIHGDFLYAGINQQFNQKELLENLMKLYTENYNEFLNLLDYITGRYTIIISLYDDVHVYTDATNTRSTYYVLNKLVVSSHVNLIIDNFDFSHSGISYALSNGLYYTKYKEVRSTIANFSLNLNTNKYTRIFPREKNRFLGLSDTKKFEIYEKISSQIFNNIINNYDIKLLSLSGGGDSRFSLALSKDFKEQILYFTYITNPNNDQSNPVKREAHKDFTIVNQIVENLDFEHKYCYLHEIKNSFSKKEDTIIRKNSVAPHSMFLINLSKKYLNYNNKTVHIRSNLYEIGQAGTYKKRYRESNLDQLKQTFDRRYKGFLKENDNLEEYDRLYEKFIEDLNYEDDIYGYHLLDLYLWEIRLSRWHSEILNTHDVCFETLSPFNHRILLEIALSFDYNQRKSGYMFQELINRNWSVLNFFGDNNVNNMYEQLRDINKN